LRERVSRMAAFQHGSYSHVLSVERLKEKTSTLALVSAHRPGVRLSQLLAFAERGQVTLNIDAALCLVRQLVPAVAVLHERAADIAHGAIAPERIVVTSGARLVVVEHVLGAALEQLRYSHERYWKDLHIALPRSAGAARFDHRADVMQVGLVALSLILGRQVTDDEYPSRIGEVVASTWAISARGGLEPLPAGLRAWLTRALQLDSKNWFRSAVEAQDDLERVLGESDYLVAPATLEAFLAQYHASLEPPVPAAVPDPPRASRQPVPAAAAPVVQVAAPSSAAVQATAPLPAYVATPVPAHAEQPSAPAPPARQPMRKELTVPPATEYSPVGEEAFSGRQPRSRWLLAAAAVALIALGGAGMVAARRFAAPSPAVTNDGTLVVNTNPPGAHVFVDGVDRGATPLTITLKAGAHAMEVRGDGPPRVMPITISAGGEVAQFIDLPKGAAQVGQLQVRTEPAGARVSVDGVAHGDSPLTVTDLQPGEHVVVVESDLGSVKQTVTVEAGITASLTVPLSGVEGAPVSGWVSLSAPAEVQVFENGRLLGSSQSDRLMVSAGRHDFEIVNQTLGYRASRTVQVAPGRVTPIKIDFPKGTLALNAIPWAEVWVDGVKIGETPIGNVELIIGSHEVVFRNPDLGEQRHAVSVSADKPGRLSVDLRKK
ncbi:MAG: PEGA domain-containing protein, partial [Acidobacteria bacterium]|nr:PEGA domain-containing protein [Acidobacteriota bacterium]